MEMKMKKWSVLFLACGLSLSACGDDSTSKNSSGNNQSTANNSTTTGSTTRTTVDVKIGDDEIKRDIPNDQASDQIASAVIAENILTLTMLSETGVSLSAVIETLPTKVAPGSFGVNAPPNGSHITVLDPLAGGGWESASGTIELKSCPKAVGQKVVGEFKNVNLAAINGGESRSLSGTFDIVVVLKQGDLNCKVEDVVTNNSTSNNNSTPDQCSADECEEGGICCEYLPCLGTCQFNCFASCATGDIAACAQCNAACFDECNVSNECVAAFEDLNSCEEANSCDPFDENEERYESCVRGSCCDEINAAY